MTKLRKRKVKAGRCPKCGGPAVARQLSFDGAEPQVCAQGHQWTDKQPAASTVPPFSD